MNTPAILRTLFERLGAFMGSGNAHLFTQEEWITLYIWDLERHFVELRQASIRANKPIEKYIFFGDIVLNLGPFCGYKCTG